MSTRTKRTSSSAAEAAAGSAKKSKADDGCTPTPIITKVTCYVLKCPLGKERFYSSQTAFPQRESTLVKIETDSGIYGWGEGGQYGPGEPVKACIDNILAPKIIGKRAQPTVLWEQMYQTTRDFGQRGTYVDAISGIDIALWDILGKSVGKPVCELLGGAHRERIGVYATGCYYRGKDVFDIDASINAIYDEALSYKNAGFTMVKIKIGLLSIKDDIARVKRAREAIGPDIKLMVDANHAYNVQTAVRVAKAIEQYDIDWFEEPVVPEDLEGYRRIRQMTHIPIAGGECSFTRYGFKDMLTTGCIDIAQPDIAATGGLSEFQKIFAMASAFGIMVVPHAWGSGVALATALQAIATLPLHPHTANPLYLQNEPVVEYDRNPNALRDDLLVEPIKFENGTLVVPRGPGLGIEVNEKVLKKYLA